MSIETVLGNKEFELVVFGGYRIQIVSKVGVKKHTT
jgi:hypothetical protein